MTLSPSRKPARPMPPAPPAEIAAEPELSPLSKLVSRVLMGLHDCADKLVKARKTQTAELASAIQMLSLRQASPAPNAAPAIAPSEWTFTCERDDQGRLDCLCATSAAGNVTWTFTCERDAQGRLLNLIATPTPCA